MQGSGIAIAHLSAHAAVLMHAPGPAGASGLLATSAPGSVGAAAQRANAATAVFNSAMIVFREGLEGVLILAAVTASFVGTNASRRRPVFAGAGLSVGAMIVTWLLAGVLLSFFTQYGERLQAVTSLVAVAVLLVILNWFLHRIYWTGWIATHHRRRRELAGGQRLGIVSAQTLGLVVLGFTSVYREGLEIVLFLQSLRLRAGAGPVGEGLAIGAAGVAVVAVLTFALHRRLPYRRMLVATGVLIAVVLVIMVGATAHTMQEVGWLGNTRLGIAFPAWLGRWLELRPSIEALVAQALALAAVGGSYVAAEAMHGRGPFRRRAGGAGAAPRSGELALAGETLGE